ncbi:MAG: acyl-CoA thioesterase [Kibdelosporangium sp.]
MSGGYFEWRHVVSFGETNLVGNVYYAHYLNWQGRCREMFLRDTCPEILDDLRSGLKLFTLKVECEYLGEISAFDEIVLRLRSQEMTQTQLAFTFDYLTTVDESLRLIARGAQRVVCMRTEGDAVVPTRVPDGLRAAVRRLTVS